MLCLKCICRWSHILISFPHSLRSSVTSASRCVTFLLRENWPCVSLRPRTWRRWTWAACLVRTEIYETLSLWLIYLMRLTQHLTFGRPVCEDPAIAEWKASKEEEDYSEEEHTEPVLQWILQLWDPSGQTKLGPGQTFTVAMKYLWHVTCKKIVYCQNAWLLLNGHYS